MSSKQPGHHLLSLPGIIAAAMILLVAGGSVFLLTRPGSDKDGIGTGDFTLRGQHVDVGGVSRPAVTVAGARLDTTVFRDTTSLQPKDREVVAPVAVDTNPGTQSVGEAIRDFNHFERLSPVFAPDDFNLDQYRAAPEEYLNVVEPGRVFQPAQPGDTVPVIQTSTPPMQSIKAGESVRLSVRVPADSPVTFTSFMLGSFENQLPSITVESDQQGNAEVTFTATPGAGPDVRIVAASPVSSGQSRFLIAVIKGGN